MASRSKHKSLSLITQNSILLQIFINTSCKIIDSLSSSESKQKSIWEEQKRIKETFYVVTVGSIPIDLYKEVASCRAQWIEWEELSLLGDSKLIFNSLLREEDRIRFLEAHPTLPIDTRYFKKEFCEKLLSNFKDLDNEIDGLLIHGENWRSLNLLKDSYKGKIKIIYIDPPYNTGNGEFLYTDTYKESSWLTMMENRLSIVKNFISDGGIIFISIDEYQYSSLKSLADHIFSKEMYLNTLIWVNNLKGRQISGKGAAKTHEYILVYGDPEASSFSIPVDFAKKVMPDAYKGLEYKVRVDHFGHYVLRNELHNTNSKYNEITRPNLVFNIHWHPDRNEIKFSEVNSSVDFKDFIKITPKKNNDGVHKYHAWRWSKNKIQRNKQDLEFIIQGGQVKIFTKVRNFQHVMFKDIITNITTESGSRELINLLQSSPFTYPKPSKLVETLVNVVQNDLDEFWVMDFFAGSGTTGHAVINLNRQDGKRRKFILVEVADYFDTILLPRIKKVIFAPEWNAGKPKRMPTTTEAERSPRLVKVIKLEKYQDAIDYANFAHMNQASNSNIELDLEFLYHTKKVDLPETFNYLLGLAVKTRKVYYNQSTKYIVYTGTLRDDRNVIVIWRDTYNWTEQDYANEVNFIRENIDINAHLVYINGKCYINEIQSLDKLFIELMYGKSSK